MVWKRASDGSRRQHLGTEDVADDLLDDRLLGGLAIPGRWSGRFLDAPGRGHGGVHTIDAGAVGETPLGEGLRAIIGPLLPPAERPTWRRSQAVRHRAFASGIDMDGLLHTRALRF